jgi:L-lactate dehydrogenase complex protein LldE
MIRHGYIELFRDDEVWRARAKALAGRTYEFSEFLTTLDTIPNPDRLPYSRLAYHPSCHLLRGLNIEDQPLDLLRSIEHLTIVSLSKECCGFGGVFAVDHAPISEEMVKRRIKAIEDMQVDGVVACDVSCLMQIEGALRRKESELRCAHLAQILAGHTLGLR